jgi:hypothetical protein
MDTVIGDSMIALILTFITQLNITSTPGAQVEVAEFEVEAVFVPAGHEGPIVAVPFDEVVF